MIRRTISLALLAVFGVLTLPLPADAQLPRVGRIVRDQVRNAGERMIGDAVACTLGNKECIEEAEENGQKVVIVDDEGKVITDENGSPITDPELAAASQEQPGTGRWIDYDYLRGVLPMFNTWWNILDPENAPATIPNPEVRVGRIPSNIEWQKGNMQIVELDGYAVLEMVTAGHFQIHLDKPLPDDFSLEWTMHTPGGWEVSVYFEPVVGQRYFDDDLDRHFLQVGRTAQISHAYNAGSPMATIQGVPAHEEFVTVKFQIEDGYALLYTGGERAQIPNFRLTGGSNIIEFYTQANARQPVYIRDIRVDYGVEDPVEVFAADGEYTTRLILFDFNSARIRPESTPELERVQKMIEDFGKPVVIAGHTDAIGSDDYNMELSAERAEAVKAYLVDQGIDADLIDTTGKGETDPVGDNETDEGRQANRRVVIASAGG